MNWYDVFYWLTIADSVKSFFDVASNIFTTFAILSFMAYAICSIGKAVQISENNIKNEGEEKVDADVRSWEIGRKYLQKFFYICLPLSLLTWTCYVFTPTKKDCLLIVAGGAVGNFITTDTASREIPSDITKYLHLSLNKEIEDLSNETKQDIKKELGVETPKDKLLESVKNLTKEQIIEFLKNDTTSIVK